MSYMPMRIWAETLAEGSQKQAMLRLLSVTLFWYLEMDLRVRMVHLQRFYNNLARPVLERRDHARVLGHDPSLVRADGSAGGDGAPAPLLQQLCQRALLGDAAPARARHGHRGRPRGDLRGWCAPHSCYRQKDPMKNSRVTAGLCRTCLALPCSVLPVTINKNVNGHPRRCMVQLCSCVQCFSGIPALQCTMISEPLNPGTHSESAVCVR